LFDLEKDMNSMGMENALGVDDLGVFGIVTLVSALIPLVSGEFRSNSDKETPQLRGADGAKMFAIVGAIQVGFWVIGDWIGFRTKFHLFGCFAFPLFLALLVFGWILLRCYWNELERIEMAAKNILDKSNGREVVKQSRGALHHRILLLVLYCFAFLFIGFAVRTYTERQGKILVVVQTGSEESFRFKDESKNTINALSLWPKVEPSDEEAPKPLSRIFWNVAGSGDGKELWFLFPANEEYLKALSEIVYISGGGFGDTDKLIKPEKSNAFGWRVIAHVKE